MPGSSSQGIFLSYRREDAAPYARLLQFQLRERFPGVQVFMDLDSIEAGLPFAKVIRDAVDTCTVLVALIGRQWVTIADEEGNRRLDNPRDYVRLEVQTALERGVRVIPVLVDGARPPREQQLPAGLQELAGLNALELSYGRYEYDAGRLLDQIQRVLAVAHDPAAAGLQAAEDAGRQAREEPGRKAQPDAEDKAPVAAAHTAREEADHKTREEADRKGPAETQERGKDASKFRWPSIELPTRFKRQIVDENEPTQEKADRETREEASLPVLEQRANSAGQAGDAASARDQYATLLPLRERVSGPEHPDTLAARACLAYWTGQAGDAASARDQYATLLPVCERVLGPEHPDTLAARASLARWTGQSGDAAGARDQYAALLPRFKQVSGVEHPDTLAAFASLAYWTGQAGDAAGARDQYAILLFISERVLGPEHPDTLAARASVARWTGQAGNAARDRD